MNNELNNRLEKLIDSGKQPYVRIEDEGRFAVTDNILQSSGLHSGQTIKIDKLRAIIQIHEKELTALQKRVLST